MKLLQLLYVGLLCLGITQFAFAVEPADSVIKNALADIQRFEQQANGLTPSRSSNAKRILKLMNLSHERLNGSKNQSDPSWQAVNQRYVNLKGQLEGLLNPSSTAASTTAAPVTSPSKSIQTQPSTTNSNSVPALVSGQRVRVKKMIKDINNVNASLITTGPSTFQDPNEVTARQKRLKQFEEALTRYPQVDDPDVQTAQNSFNTLKKALSDEFKRSREQLKSLGDVQQRLATIEENSRKYAMPQGLTAPFSETDAKVWVEAAGAARTVAEHNLKELAQMAPLAYLPNNPGTPQTGSPYDANDITRLQNNAATKLKNVEAGYQDMASGFSNRFKQIESDVLTRWQENPDSEKRWIFLQDARKEEAFKLFDESIAVAKSSAALEAALGRDTAVPMALVDKIEHAKKEFIRKSEIALNTSRMPEAVSKDKGMLKIAKEIVKNPKYEFGEHGKIVLTTDQIVERERKDSEIEIDDAEVTLGGDLKMSGTETTWTYKWKEFKFAVPLKETDSDKWYIWWITAKNFSSGDSRTPINKWISGTTTKGNPILKKNL